MDTLYDQLLELQNIPHAYEEWAAYRAALTDFIVGHTRAGASVVIIGAGACNDFDLKRIAAHFSQTLLLDRNEAALRSGLERQAAASGTIRMIRADLLGISDATYRAMCDALLHELRGQLLRGEDKPGEIERIFLARMQDAFQTRQPCDFMQGEAVADYVVCCGVHSQLIGMFPQMAGVYRNHSNLDTGRIDAAARAMNAVIAQELNTSLLRLAGVGVILGLEKARLGMPGGIEGATQAFQDIENRNARVVNQTTLLWPFDGAQGKIYETKIMEIEA